MYVVTCLTSPKIPGLDHTLVESLRAAWGGHQVRWLALNEAAEFTLAEVPSNRWEVWEDLQKLGVDLVVQPVDGRRKRMLLADMDSTMIQQECIDELADEAGVGARVKDITARAMNGELDFEGALIERVGLLAGLPEAVIARVLDTRITLMPGGPELVGTMRANTLIAEKGTLTGEVGRPILGRQAKIEALEHITQRLGISESEVIAVGDGANDLGMLGRAGTGVALHAKPVVAAECDVRINFGDLSALLFIQGYARADFVTA